MAKKFDRLRKGMSPASQARADAMARQMLAEMALREIREAVGMTQTELADIMGIRQASLSKIEHQPDMQLSTLRRIIAALGGELQIIAKFPTGQVTIGPLGETIKPNDEPRASA